jgi:molybdate transport system substrate-binding protein
MRMARIAVAAAVASFASACGGGPQRLAVCAAASLKAAFEQIDRDFAAAHDGLQVDLNTAGSQALEAQVEAGAPCDVLATADLATMDALVTSGHVGPPERFASNTLVILVPASNPAGLERWQDLARASRIALAAPEAPVGTYARKFIANADALQPGFAAAVDARTRTLELDVRHVVMRVRQGEVDAAIAYRTDAATDGVKAIRLPPALDVTADYQIAVVTKSTAPELAADYVAYVLASGQQALAAKGFGSPRR